MIDPNRIFSVRDDEEFDRLALEVFRFQVSLCAVPRVPRPTRDRAAIRRAGFRNPFFTDRGFHEPSGLCGRPRAGDGLYQ